MKKRTAILLNILFTVLLAVSVLALIVSTYAGMEGNWQMKHTIMLSAGLPLTALSVAALNYIDRHLPI